MKYDKEVLLEKIKENRKNHRAIVEDALNGFKAEAIKILENKLARIKSGQREVVYVCVEAPMDMTREYDATIAELEMTVETTIELDRTSFRQFVLDDWDWKERFRASNSKYSKMI